MVDVTISNYQNNINNSTNNSTNNIISNDINNINNTIVNEDENHDILSEKNNYDFLIQKKHLKNKLNKVYSFSNMNDECAICLDDINLGKEALNKDVVQLTCKHIFHYNCLYKWLINSQQIRNKNFKCPTCNQLSKVDVHFECQEDNRTEDNIDINIYL